MRRSRSPSAAASQRKLRKRKSTLRAQEAFVADGGFDRLAEDTEELEETSYAVLNKVTEANSSELLTSSLTCSLVCTILSLLRYTLGT